MSFANPLLLLGLLGAAVPVLIHLINRRRPRKQPFPAMQLLMQSVQRVERRWRLRRILLLALRVLLLAALALAAAGPLIGEDQPRGDGGVVTGPERIALVIDASLSMQARYEGRSVFDRALAEARERVERLGPEDQMLLVISGVPPRIPIPRPTSDRGRLLGVIGKLEPIWRPTSLSEAVSAAAAALGRADGSAAEGEPAEPMAARVVVLSDLAKPTVDGAAALQVMGRSEAASVEVVDLLADIPPEARVNHGFIGTSAEPVPGPVPRTVEVLARVQSYAARGNSESQPRDLTLKLGDDEIARGIIEIAPGAQAQKALRHAFERAGTLPCTVELEPDVLAEDDVSFLAVEVHKQVRTLVVDGDPSGIAKEDEAFYLLRALEAGASDQPTPRTISADDLARTDLGDFEVVILAGVSSVSRAESERLVGFVEAGGGLWISAAEGMDLDAWATGLGPILPRRFRGMKRAEAGRGIAFDTPLLEHPVMRLFEGEALGGLLTTQTQAFLLLEPGGDRPMTTLLEFEGGAPALVVAPAGQGRIALLATSVDRDLGDLPIRPAFVPLVRQLVLFLGDALAEPDRRRTLVGEARDIDVPTGATRLEIRAPDGRVERFGLESLGQGTVRYASTERPGHYEVRVAFGGELETFERARFAVNVDPLESDLRPVEPEEVAAVLRGEATLGEGSLAVTSPALSRRFDSAGISTLLLLLMGLAFVAESALTAVRTGR